MPHFYADGPPEASQRAGAAPRWLRRDVGPGRQIVPCQLDHCVATIGFLFFNPVVFRNVGRWGNFGPSECERPRGPLPALGLFCASTAQAQAAAYVLGDSLGLGVAQAAHLKNLSKISIHIRGPKMLKQIAQTPSGSTVFLVLGTNDAEGSIARLDKNIDDHRPGDGEEEHHAWSGSGRPACARPGTPAPATSTSCCKNRFENTAVRYVSMRDEAMCSGAFHERDGVHLKMKGYAHMWEKARSADGLRGRRRDAPEPRRRAYSASCQYRAVPERSTGHSEEGQTDSASGAAQTVPVTCERALDEA